MSKTSWFSVDKAGLAMLMDGRSKAFVVYELLQNAWDQNVTEVRIDIERVAGRLHKITVLDDDPEGFADLSHAYTLFAQSAKKSDAKKRGRFNLGEKLVLALASNATITTTKGSITFDADGVKHHKTRRDKGSCIVVEIKMTIAEGEELLQAARNVISPSGIRTYVNGVEVLRRGPLTSFETRLATVIAEDDGVLRPTKRNTVVVVYDPLEGEVGTLFEMGIPVVETGDQYHVDVQQKVPLNMNRDNVPPAYLRDLRVAVVNATHHLESTDLTQRWVGEALADKHVSDAAIKTIIEARFGANAVAYDPSDPEANKISVAEGRQIVYGGHLSVEQWSNVRRAAALPAAGTVTPSPKPYSVGGKDLKMVSPEQWSEGIAQGVHLARVIAREVLGAEIVVRVANEPMWPFSATYGPGDLTFNLGRLGHKFFDALCEGVTKGYLNLLIHEFGHHYERDHLSRNYNDALTKIGAAMTHLALTKPELFRWI